MKSVVQRRESDDADKDERRRTEICWPVCKFSLPQPALNWNTRSSIRTYYDQPTGPVCFHRTSLQVEVTEHNRTPVRKGYASKTL